MDAPTCCVAARSKLRVTRSCHSLRLHRKPRTSDPCSRPSDRASLWGHGWAAARPLRSQKASCCWLGTSWPRPPRSPEPSHTSHHQAVAGQGPCLVEAAHLHFASKGDPEGLCTVHIWEGKPGSGSCQAPALGAPALLQALTEFGQGNEGSVDSQRQLDGQLGGHNGCEDQCAFQKQLVAVPAGILGA